MDSTTVIEYTDTDRQSQRVTVDDLLDTEKATDALRAVAERHDVATTTAGYWRSSQDLLADLAAIAEADPLAGVDDDDLARALTGSADAVVLDDVTPLDLKADAARREAYDQAKNSLEVTVDRILAGRDETDIPVYDDDPDDLIGVWIYTGDPHTGDTGARLCYRWHADLPAGVEAVIDSFTTNSPDGDWGDIEDTAISLTAAQRKQLDKWVAMMVAADYEDRIIETTERLADAREQLDYLLTQAVNAGASKTFIAQAAGITRQTLDARIGAWRRKEGERRAMTLSKAGTSTVPDQAR